MAKPKVIVVIRDGIVHALVSNDDIECLVLDFDVMEEEVPEELEKQLAAAQAPFPLTPGDPAAELEAFNKAGAERTAELNEFYNA